MIVNTKDDGYRGIWTYEGSLLTAEPHRYVHYSGGLATSFSNHLPMAYYAPEANKTFFCYGGTRKDKSQILIMASYYDHATGEVPRPTILMDKGTDDSHDNPSLALDDKGFVWVFPSAHGRMRPAYIFRSLAPYAVDAFEMVRETNFSYPEPWFIEGQGFLFLHTLYMKDRRFLYWSTSTDGMRWAESQCLAQVVRGHYQVSWRHGTKVGTAFNYHPKVGGSCARTNLYYAQTRDFGRTWQNAMADLLQTPLTDVQNPALVHDYEAEGLQPFLMDLNFDAQGNPVILYILSRNGEAGLHHGPRRWMTARWTGNRWDIRWSGIVSDNNYDCGCLHIEQDGLWQIIGPTGPGPQPANTGGEVGLWTSPDQGTTWTKQVQVTRNSSFNHTYVRRPVNAHPDFYAFWADGHARQFSESRLYFCDASGRRVYRLPLQMNGDRQQPEVIV